MSSLQFETTVLYMFVIDLNFERSVRQADSSPNRVTSGDRTESLASFPGRRTWYLLGSKFLTAKRASAAARRSLSCKCRTATEATACPSSIPPPSSVRPSHRIAAARTPAHLGPRPSVCCASSSRATRTHFLRRYAAAACVGGIPSMHLFK